MNARTQALLWDFCAWFAIGFLVAAVPILEATMAAGPDNFTLRNFVWALLTAVVAGLVGAVRKLLAPQLVSIGEALPGNKPTIVGVALKDVNPAPAKVQEVQAAAPEPAPATSTHETAK